MFILKKFSASDIARVEADVLADSKCHKAVRNAISKYVRASGAVPNNWVVNEASDAYLVFLTPLPYVNALGDAFAAFVDSRVYRIRVIFDETSEVYFSEENPPPENEQERVQQLIIAALKVHGQYGLGPEDENPHYKYYSFIPRPSSDSQMGGL
ncbi:hypothetical protein [Roseateles amylovorans]|uniref:Uncharacterized protein n=1 Tax=Roseateles amylovorans TaxID=2978473 RepID=A0ABY6B2S4_9BURK|nr:hypothetical protein [Roseateles amylovorans]UXH78838.1 hypothetical protein N4261_02540 [Roseateles amylovorans]